MVMNKVEHQADCALWTPWGPQFPDASNPAPAKRRASFPRIKTTRLADSLERERADKPECAYEP